MAEAVAAAAPAREGKKRGKKGLVLVVAAVIVLGGGGAGAFVALRARPKGEAAPAQEAAEKAVEPPGASRSVLSLEPFVVNLADKETDRYVRCTAKLALEGRDTAARLTADELAVTRVRDRILTLLSSKTFAEVATPEGKESLRREIQEQVAPVLERAKVTDVYYTEFIVQ